MVTGSAVARGNRTPFGSYHCPPAIPWHTRGAWYRVRPNVLTLFGTTERVTRLLLVTIIPFQVIPTVCPVCVCGGGGGGGGGVGA